MSAQRLGRRGIILSVVGIVLVILGVLWSTVIFPMIAQIPTSYERTFYFDGNFTVLDAASQSMISFPIEQTLAQKAIGTQEGALLIHEKRTIINAATQTDLSSVYGDEKDRKSVV